MMPTRLAFAAIEALKQPDEGMLIRELTSDKIFKVNRGHAQRGNLEHIRQPAATVLEYPHLEGQYKIGMMVEYGSCEHEIGTA